MSSNNTNISTFKIINPKTFKQKALAFANETAETVCYLDSNGYETYPYSSKDCLIGIGSKANLTVQADNFAALQQFHEDKKDWLFGFLTYDLKNEVEKLSSNNLDNLHFPKIHFFQAEIVLQINANEVIIQSDKNPSEIFKAIQNTNIATDFQKPNIELKPRTSKAKYLEIINTIREHIIEGDLYEMNFCQEFFAENISLSPIDVFNALNEKANAPFTAFYKTEDKYLLCSSPERFLKKAGQQLISQPIKGTSKRSDNPETDKALREALLNDEKNRAENVMIVDLVRNDLAKTCRPGSVSVEELFGIYTFEKVHQMISTVVGELPKETPFIQAIKNAFPMGSMTGAPKVMSMQLIEKYEVTKRGLYSGTVGYISPDGDFDFNVVIRSLLYNAVNQYLSLQVGGAIVYDSDAAAEYEECLLKAEGVFGILG